MRAWPLIALLTCALNETSPPPVRVLDNIKSSTPAVLDSDARAMAALEDAGLSLAHVLGANGADNASLAASPAWDSVAKIIEADIGELEKRPGITDWHPRKRFQLSWLRDRRARFDLVAVVNRLDRKFLDPSTCGDARLVYRLVVQPDGRPPSMLPMTVNIGFPQPKGPGPEDCAAAAQAWLDLPAGGAERVRAIAALFARLKDYSRLEVNLQTFHGNTRAVVFEDGSGYDDHAEYLLRSFDRAGERLVPRVLVDTPRFDLSEDEKRDLATWIRDNFQSIDNGNWVIPDRFLAKTALSVTPRGFGRIPNRVFKSLFGDGAIFKDLPYGKAQTAKSPLGLLRRLDQGTCEGCHMTRSVAGFHMLGESRVADSHFDAVAMPRSAHLDVELEWREQMTTAAARHEPFTAPRPIAERRRPGPGRAGAHCAVSTDPMFAGWTCASGLVCHPSGNDDVGTCVVATATGVGMGDPCQDVKIVAEDSASDGDHIIPEAMAPCAIGAERGQCDPNLLGFAGGMCIADCSQPGALMRDGELACSPFPAAGYENDCFVNAEPIETCIAKHVSNRVLRTCGEGRPCRDDYACGRMSGMPPKSGVCVPTYSVYGLRVDGPILDR